MINLLNICINIYLLKDISRIVSFFFMNMDLRRTAQMHVFCKSMKLLE